MRTFLIALLLMLFVITPCFAKTHGTPDGKGHGTPDGQTPHVETVCNGETGAAFGLCNAYCEAMDCDSDNRHASIEACNKIKEQYKKHTGNDLHCKKPKVSCPCIDISEFAAFLDYDDINDFSYCDNYHNENEIHIEIGASDSVYIYISNVISSDSTCKYVDGEEHQVSMVLTEEELDACKELLLDKIDKVGLSCWQ